MDDNSYKNVHWYGTLMTTRKCSCYCSYVFFYSNVNIIINMHIFMDFRTQSWGSIIKVALNKWFRRCQSFKQFGHVFFLWLPPQDDGAHLPWGAPQLQKKGPVESLVPQANVTQHGPFRGHSTGPVRPLRASLSMLLMVVSGAGITVFSLYAFYGWTHCKCFDLFEVLKSDGLN